MENKDLKKLSRLELLEILLEQTKRIEQLEDEITKLNNKLDSKKVLFDESGSLAEASLKLTEIFKEADEAIAIYKENAFEAINKEEKQRRKECRELKKKALEEIETKCKKREEQAEKRLKDIEEKIKKASEVKKLTKKVSESKAKTSKRKFKK